jgi:hypothetical protein
MTIISKHPISTGDGKGGKIIIPKGVKGSVKAISNSKKIREAFPNLEHKPDGYFYICSFPDYIDEILCDLSQIEISS